ncbi:hypothetical protein H0H92_008225 [Tricholoma furcatifolium]|nr:hypothetical protein H0H92_008225 [Tricholoma furcatifolium]
MDPFGTGANGETTPAEDEVWSVIGKLILTSNMASSAFVDDDYSRFGLQKLEATARAIIHLHSTLRRFLERSTSLVEHLAIWGPSH